VPKKKNIKYREEQVYICTCGIKAKDKIHEGFFSWQNVGGTVVMLCWNCADKLHRDVSTKEKEQEIRG
jgi:hypothetical protein|tara:strand:+ start:1505 stop:1708 length:204 start_codon:yes stop_codon:yes gene_type:complete